MITVSHIQQLIELQDGIHVVNITFSPPVEMEEKTSFSFTVTVEDS